MEKFIYVVKDKVMDEVSIIYIANNDNHARMIFENSLKQSNEAGYHCEFDLILVGTIDMVSADVDYITPPKVINPLHNDFDFDEVEK